MAHIHGPESHYTDPLIEVLIRLYSDGYTALLQRIARGIRAGKSTRYQRALLRDVDRILQDLREQTQKFALGLGGVWEQSTLFEAMAMGQKQAETELAKLGVTVRLSTGFAKVSEEAVRVLARNVAYDLYAGIDQVERRAKQFIGRSVDDVFRQAQLNTVGRKLTQGLTVRQARDDLIAQLVDNGIPAFVDVKGRSWSLPSYAEMAVRTVTREASTLGALQRFEDGGLDLVIVSTHSPTCGYCAMLQGRVYSISGKAEGYPKLERHPPFHPRCGHVLSAYIPEMDKDREARKAFSNRPFEDDRSKKEIESYSARQELLAVQRERRQILAQLKSGGVPLSKRMQEWTAELQAPGTSAARRTELTEKLQDQADRWEAGRRARYKELGNRLKELKGAI